jgi:hypothetical protein
MKNIPFRLKMSAVVAFAAIWVLGSGKPATAQEKPAGEKQKKVIVKVMSDDNGTTTVIDTTMEFPETAMDDSVKHEVEKVIEMSRGGKHGRMKINCIPGAYSYNFDMPCPPECRMRLEDLEDLDFDMSAMGADMENMMFEEMSPRIERRIIRSEGGGQSLNDLLGDIPMSRVKNYSIKDTKNGKRIVIDLDDSPVVERQDRVIVIRDGGRTSHGGNYPQKKMRVIVNTGDDDKKGDDPQDQQAPPPPPPPPPVKK